MEVAGANRRWRWPFRCRGSRRESAVAQLSTLGDYRIMNTMPVLVVVALLGGAILLCYIVCRLTWIYTKRLPVWLRLLLRSLLAALLFSPSIYAGQGGVMPGPAFFYFFISDRTHIDIIGAAVIPILVGWVVFYLLSFVFFGICYWLGKCATDVEKRKKRHVT
jgi:hypothetical protein